jgi:hypothetical protein
MLREKPFLLVSSCPLAAFLKRGRAFARAVFQNSSTNENLIDGTMTEHSN